MRANVVFIWLVASTFALSVKSKPHGKHKSSHTANEKDVLPEEANEGQVLPTFITFEASSQEQEDEEMSSEDNANAHTNKADGVLEGPERNDKSTPVLLSEEELVDLLKEELKESEEAEESVEEEESVEDKESEEEGEKADEGKIQSEKAGDIIETEGAEQEESDVEETSEEEDTKLSDEVEEEEMKEENEKEMEKEEREAGEEVMPVEASEGDSVSVAEESGVEETDGSTGSEIPADLDYAADSDSSQPLQTEPQADDARLLSKTDVADVREEDEVTSEKAATATADDYEQDFQNTEASDSGEEAADQGNDKGEGSPAETKSESDVQEPKSSVELGGARLAGKEDAAKEESGNNDSASHAKGKKRKHKKNQRVRKHPMQRDEGQQGRGRIQEDTEGSNIDNTVHKAKRRRAGKWATLVGMNPVQIRATVDLYPSARPSLVGGIHRPEAPADPCDNFRCKRGKTCKLDENNKPSCVCRQPSECPPSVNEFDNVCGTDNNTYDTSCELFATKCNLEGTKKGHRLHLDYTGPCKFIAPCLDTELIQFPLRMRDWLKNVLLQLYEHDSMTPGFLTSKQRVRVRKIYESERRLHAGDHTLELLAQDFEKNYNMYIYPVHWQFAQIDQHPPDRFLSHSELAPLRVPLVPMEHCTSRFFQECDADKDKQVSFKEWTQCFGIKDEDMDVNLLF